METLKKQPHPPSPLLPAGRRGSKSSFSPAGNKSPLSQRTRGAKVVTTGARLGVGGEAGVIKQLSMLDRLLPLWIGAAMAVGLLLGRVFPGFDQILGAVKIGTISLPIAIGLIAMMYPVLAKVRYDRLGSITSDRKLLVPSLLLNWVIGPALMFALAWIFLPDLPAYRTGLIIVGLARCIAMVLIWNELACGDREAAALLVAVNSIFQIAAYSLLGYFYLELLPGWLGLEQHALHISLWEIARMVLLFLGVPLAAGFLTRYYGVKLKGNDWYERKFIPRISPMALWGLLFTIVVLFALQGNTIISQPLNVARIALPLLVYFILMWGVSFAWGLKLKLPYTSNVTLSFTAAGNNFELAIAVAIGVFGVTSGEALAGVVGPLIEVPALVCLVYVALWAQRRFYHTQVKPELGVQEI
jgi:ACR3 family arsenite transporter